MHIIKNSIINIIRYKNKYALYGALYVVLITAATVCTIVFIQMIRVIEQINKEYDILSRELSLQPNGALDELIITQGLVANILNQNIIFTVVILLFMLIITAISTYMLLDGRKYEIAVLRSVGMTKIRLILGYVVENLAFIWISCAISIIITQMMARALLGWFYESLRVSASFGQYAWLTQTLTAGTVIQASVYVFSGTTFIILVSLILACISIVRFQPLKVFSQQY